MIPIKFAVVGVVNTLAGLILIYLCKWLLGFGDVMANACGYLIQREFPTWKGGGESREPSVARLVL